ncbi:MAG: hypothetical protein HZB10_03980 [Candidatus Yonathbacteria bacterium]|nr:hypothetical protein [Candidatus Yonathbacteria bacterium]
MENFGIEQLGFNNRAREGGLVPTIESFEILAGKAGQRIQIKNNPAFEKTYSPDVIHADAVESDAFFKKYHQQDSSEFRPAMLAEELIKIGGTFGLFGSRAKVMQASQYDDYKNNADVIVEIATEYHEKKDEKFLRPKERFVIDITTDKGERFAEKIANLSAELRNGRMTNVKYFPGGVGSLREIPRFILAVDDEELLAFFAKAKQALDRAGGASEKRFADQYEEFSLSACEKILSNARLQVEYIAQCAVRESFPRECSERLLALLSSPLGGFYQTLEYIEGLNVENFGITDEGKKKMNAGYISMMKKILEVGVTIDRVLNEKKSFNSGGE